MKPVSIQTGKYFFAPRIVQNSLLICGLLASSLYLVMNILCAMKYDGYSAVSQTVSELSAIGAPTRPLWNTLAIIYSFLSVGFAWGIWLSGADNKRLRIVGILLLANAAIGFFWPPMHQREVLAAGGATLTDTFHIVFTIATVALMILAIGFGATAFGRSFRIYSIVTLAFFVVFGIMTGANSNGLEANLPTPYIGVWERLNIAAYMLWIVVLSITLLKRGR